MKKEVTHDGAGAIQRGEHFFVGNHPALDLINTRPRLGEGRVEQLGSFDQLLAWLTEGHRLTPAEAETLRRDWSERDQADVMREVWRLRRALETVAEEYLAGRPADTAALEEINRLLALTVAPPRVEAVGKGFRLLAEASPRAPADLLRPLAQDGLDLLTQCDLSRLRRCQGPGCVFVFYDTSRNRSRRWCSMALCGNRSKVARHYRRQRSDVT